MKRMSPKCRHADIPVIVTNQPDGYDAARPHASSRVCARPECVSDAMAFVLDFTGEKPWWREDGRAWSDQPPARKPLAEVGLTEKNTETKDPTR